MRFNIFIIGWGKYKMEKRKSILLDVDEVVCFSGILQAVNDFLGTEYVIDDFTDYYIDEVAIPKERFSEFNHFLDTRNLYANACLLPGAIESIKELNEVYDIYPCSSCINPFNIKGSSRLFADKYNFLIENLPFIDPERFILTSAKHMFKADIKIDDRVPNLNGHIETKILFPSYHNKNIINGELKEKGIVRAGYDWITGWDEVKTILLGQPQCIENSDSKAYCLKIGE